MLLAIPDVLTKAQVSECRRHLDAADWVDGNVTSGRQSALAKRNTQLPQDGPVAREVGTLILDVLGRNPQFIAASLPHRVYPPLFNRYGVEDHFHAHVDNAIRVFAGNGQRMRTDLSATLFFSEPDEYDGGELTIDDTYGEQRVKLPAGHMVIYPSTSLHRVTPITRGTRIAAFFWIQSMVRDDGQRALLYQLDNAIQSLCANVPEHQANVALTGVYHNLLRRWTEL